MIAGGPTWHTLWTVNLPSTLVPAMQFAVGDPVRTRTVYSSILFLIAVGVGLLVLTVWLVRATRAEPEFLAPLELMGRRKWRRSDPVAQRRLLDAVRPQGAEPLSPSLPPPSGDPEFDLGPRLRGFEDLSSDGDVDLDSDSDGESGPAVDDGSDDNSSGGSSTTEDHGGEITGSLATQDNTASIEVNPVAPVAPSTGGAPDVPDASGVEPVVDDSASAGDEADAGQRRT